MSKIITSPVTRFHGTVTLPDAMDWGQYIAWEKALAMAIKERESEAPTVAGIQHAWLPGIKAVVETWNIDGITEGNIPPKPRQAVSELVSWLVGEISALYEDAETVPNP